jgi:hypothetical protein
MAQDRETFKTGPYKWQRSLIKRLAEAAGCYHEFEFYKEKTGTNTKTTEYRQHVTGASNDIARVDRAQEKVFARIEEQTREKFPGPHMFAAKAAAYRCQLAEAIDAEAEIKAVS